MNQKTEELFKAWLKLTEDEKREFIKELIHYNNLTKDQQKAVNRSYEKS